MIRSVLFKVGVLNWIKYVPFEYFERSICMVFPADGAILKWLTITPETLIILITLISAALAADNSTVRIPFVGLG